MNLQENPRNHGNLMKIIAQLHERTLNSKKRSHYHLFLWRM